MNITLADTEFLTDCTPNPYRHHNTSTSHFTRHVCSPVLCQICILCMVPGTMLDAGNTKNEYHVTSAP